MNPLLLGGIVETVGKIADDLFTSDEERAKAELDAYTAETDRLANQTRINEIEAGSSSSFTSGWRPFVGWTCGLALAYVSVLEPVARFVSQVFFGYTGAFPVIDTDLTLQVLLGMLGLGGLRTFEKHKGLTK